MRIGIFAPLTNPRHTPDYIAALGQGAEERGFHSLWLGEHVVLFDDYASQYPYAEDGRIPVGGDQGLLDPIAGLGFLAAVTRRIRLGTAICLVPQRDPVYTAKEIATLDYLSGGRIDFGVGVGWLKEEFDALQVPFARRGARTREYLEVIRRLWCDPVAEFAGDFYTLPACRQNPKPLQSPHPPIYFGGESKAALRRVATLGQGWHGFDQTPEQAAANVARLGEYLTEQGRRIEDIEVVVSPYARPIESDELARYRDAGVDQVTLMVASGSVEKLMPWLDRLAEDFVEPAARL
jgi:probable F420-dependent oxidoreductase